MKLALSQQVFEKISNIKFHKNPSNRSRVVPREQTDGLKDGHDETNSRYPQFFKSA
jgi:hypothetical protein